MDWNNISLGLSSEVLNQQINPPEITSWILSLTNPTQEGQQRIMSLNRLSNEKYEAEASMPAVSHAQLKSGSYLPTLVNNSTNAPIPEIYVAENNFNAFYNINHLVPIVNGDNVKLDLEKTTIPVDLKLKAYPRENKVSQSYQIEVKNLHNFPVTIELHECLPVASNKDIEVENSGDITTWEEDKVSNVGYQKTITIQPQEVKKFNYSVSISYPKDMQIIGF